MRILLIHNPKAGDRKHGKKQLMASLTRCGHQAFYQSIKERGWKQAFKKPVDLVIAAGGDGTVHKTAWQITDGGIPLAILPLPTTSQSNQTVKARREVVARAISSLSQTRTWNLLIDVVAQSGRYKPNATSLQNDFLVEGEQHYWVHVAIDRLTGQVIDKQIEVVNE